MPLVSGAIELGDAAVETVDLGPELAEDAHLGGEVPGQFGEVQPAALPKRNCLVGGSQQPGGLLGAPAAAAGPPEQAVEPGQTEAAQGPRVAVAHRALRHRPTRGREDRRRRPRHQDDPPLQVAVDRVGREARARPRAETSGVHSSTRL